MDVKNIIKNYHREKGCNYFVMDYIHMTQQLITEISSISRGMKLREDQILFLFADELKNLCNDLNIFILAITQLNDKYNETTIRNESLLRGAKSLADRIDCGCIDLKPTKQELDAVKNIISHIVGCPPINLVRHVYKLRRGKLSKIRIFQSADLGTCRVRDVFATNFDGELIPIDATNIENLDSIIEDNSINLEEIEAGTQEEQEETQKFFKLDF
jgi:replicative DNA helicase